MGVLTDEEAVESFREFLRIPSVSGDGPSGPYSECVRWLEGFCKKIGLATTVVEALENKPVLVATLPGNEPHLPTLLLNSHYDVVPVMREYWDVDPWAAVIKDGKIYGRGAQDMKCVCVQYLFALERMVARGFKPRRTIHLTFVPDEEIGGHGMASFLKSQTFQQMGPIALALDEGLANPNDAFTAFYGERTAWFIKVRATGPTGHGSRFIKDTAPQKLLNMAQKALEFRASQEKQLGHDHHGCKHAQAKKMGDVTTINLTMLKAGVSTDGGKTYALNVIPTDAEAGFDCRISPELAPKDFEELLNSWCRAEEGVSWEFVPWVNHLKQHYVTDISDSNPWWVIFSQSIETNCGIKVEPEVFPAGTDSRFLRSLGIPALGFSPMRKCEILLHEHNEYLPVETFLEGIRVYEVLLEDLGLAPEPAKDAKL